MTVRARERGSALILAILVVVVLTLLGISFLLVAETENRIAENERLSSQALYFAEAGVRAVVQWFDRPGSTVNLANPPLAAIDRTLRWIDDDGDPATPPHLQDGVTWPRYKQDVDLNGDGLDDVFDRPYRFDVKNTFFGIKDRDHDGPDIRIDREAAGASHDFLETLSEALMSGYPGAEAGIKARISRIDIYAPPYLRIGGDWTRHGIATVEVTGRVYRTGQGSDQILAERMVKAVLNEVPYATPYGPLHSCGGITISGALPIHWGAVTAVGDVRLDVHTRIPASLPRDIPSGVKLDLLWGYDPPPADNESNFTGYRTVISGMAIEDPWLRVLSGTTLALGGVPAPAGTQPWSFTGWSTPLASGQYPHHEPGIDGTHSNLYQGLSLVGCPEFDYDLWKTIAASGRDAVEYYAWDSGDRFKRDGIGLSRTFRDITDVDPLNPGCGPALLFFDTRDGQPPRDDDGDGTFDNLTPALAVEGGTWAPRGFIYLNADSLRTTSVSGRTATMRAPGEPFLDKDQNGRYDGADRYVNLSYPASLGGAFRADPNDYLQNDDSWGTGAVRNDRGRLVTSGNDNVSLDGILYTSGRFDASGGGVVHSGSIIAHGGVWQSNPSAGAPDVYWDESIFLDTWPRPPADWNLPRVFVTRWETGM